MRRSVRAFANQPLRLSELGQLLWAAQGITGPDDRRSAPSAGATYPLEVLVVAARVDGLAAGTYRYRPGEHALTSVPAEDRLAGVVQASGGKRAWMEEAPAILVLAAVEERTARRYGERAARYVHMEVGAVAENVHLQAVALGMGTTVVGAFDDERLRRAVGVEPEEQVLALLPVGVPR